MGVIMTSKIVQPDFWNAANEIEQKQKPYKYITQDEFIEFAKNSLACLFKSSHEMAKLNEFLILNILECQDKIIEQDQEIKALKNP